MTVTRPLATVRIHASSTIVSTAKASHASGSIRRWDLQAAHQPIAASWCKTPMDVQHVRAQSTPSQSTMNDPANA